MFAVGPSVSVVLVHTLAIFFSYLRLFIAYKYPKAQITGRNILDKPMTYIKVLKEKQIVGQNSLFSVHNKGLYKSPNIWWMAIPGFTSLLSQGAGMKWRAF